MATKEPAIGDTVLCDGQTHLIIRTLKRYSNDEEKLFTLVVFENTERKVTGLLSDLRWDSDLGHWYLWGRCLSKPDRALVAELRDRGLLPARRTRAPGSAPAGGEHLGLYRTLFHGRDTGFWRAAMDRLRAGGGLAEEVLGAIEDYKVVFKKKLVDGYAIVDADDSEGVV